MLHYGMFIRWLSYETRAKRKSRVSLIPAGPRWSAILVETVRIDGKPRQRHIACLASIRGTDIGAQCKFWERVTRKLDSLSNWVTAEERQRIEAQIAKKVPCPSQEQYEHWKGEARAILGDGWVKPALTHWPA